MGCANTREKQSNLQKLCQMHSDSIYSVREMKTKDFQNGVCETYKTFFKLKDTSKMTIEQFEDFYNQIGDSRYTHKIFVVIDNMQKDPQKKIIGVASLIIRPKIYDKVKLVGYIEDIASISPLLRSQVESRLLKVLHKVCILYDCVKIILHPYQPQDWKNFVTYGFKFNDTELAQEVDVANLLMNNSPVFRISEED